jgi:hypothetical protein
MTDSSLTSDDTDRTPDPTGDLTVVTRVTDVGEALAIKGCLLAADIPATIGDQNLVMQGNPWGGAGSNIRVLVPEALAVRAREVIAEFRAGAFEIEGDPDPELAPPTTASDLALWGPDLAAFLSLWLTPVFGATLHWLNSRALGVPALARRASTGLALAVAATAFGFWFIRARDWDLATPFLAGGVVSFYTGFWYLFIAHEQSKHIARSFGNKYRHRNVWLAAAVTFGVLLAVGYVGQSLRMN